MLSEKEIISIINLFKRLYPQPLCALEYKRDYELLFAARLSAQCTDERVNKVTPELFSKYPSLETFAAADICELEGIIHSCGFYRIKARDIVAAANKLLSDYEGKVPDSMHELLTIPGVGRKTANLMLGDIHGKPAIVVDTHCIRLSNRIGLLKSPTQNPDNIEQQLRKVLPEDESSDFCHRLVLHGREICTARNPKCALCGISKVCRKYIT